MTEDSLKTKDSLEPTTVLVKFPGREDLSGTIDTTRWPLDGPDPRLMMRLSDGRELIVPRDALAPEADGTYRVTQMIEGFDNSDAATIVIPVVEEVPHVTSELVETGRVRVVKTVREEEQVIDRPLMQEHVDVQRVAVNQFIQTPPAVRYEGQTLVIPLVEEVLVVEKRLMLKEELHLTRKRTVQPHQEHVTVRIENARIERVHPGQDDRATRDEGTNKIPDRQESDLRGT